MRSVTRWRSMYSIRYEQVLCYMLQVSEYSLKDFWRWWKSVHDFMSVSNRGDLVRTQFGQLLYGGVASVSFLVLIIAGLLMGSGITEGHGWIFLLGLLLIVCRPIIVTCAAICAVAIGNAVYMRPLLTKKIALATSVFADTKAIKIAVLGSYGKTTMKELLATVIGDSKQTAATPATKNVAISHAAFAASLTGDEEVIIVEFGEGMPGDTKLFTDMFKPDFAVVTGLAPAHLDAYGSVEAILKDFSYIKETVKPEHIFVQGSDNALAAQFAGSQIYSDKGVGDWKVRHISVTTDGLGFELHKGKHIIAVRSGLLGRHQVGPLSAVAAVASAVGIDSGNIEKGLAKTVPYEHRMQPRFLGGALIIDDTYNGNIEGIKAGIALLSELPAKRKIYVTPGLVEQGSAMETVHRHIGSLLADANFDEVVLMKNTATPFILEGIGDAEIHVTQIDNPLEYYQNLEYTVAQGDVVLLQNDLPDRYM